MIMIVGILTVRSDAIEQVKELLKEVRTETRKEHGCISYDGHVSLEDPTKFVFIERWASREAFDRHPTKPHMVCWRKASAELIVGRNIEVIHVARIESPSVKSPTLPS
jgi:quinol monooxygenase YgiN